MAVHQRRSGPDARLPGHQLACANTFAPVHSQERADYLAAVKSVPRIFVASLQPRFTGEDSLLEESFPMAWMLVQPSAPDLRAVLGDLLAFHSAMR